MVDIQALEAAITKVRPEYLAMTDDEIIREYMADTLSPHYTETSFWELLIERERRGI